MTTDSAIWNCSEPHVGGSGTDLKTHLNLCSSIWRDSPYFAQYTCTCKSHFGLLKSLEMWLLLWQHTEGGVIIWTYVGESYTLIKTQYTTDSYSHIFLLPIASKWVYGSLGKIIVLLSTLQKFTKHTMDYNPWTHVYIHKKCRLHMLRHAWTL